MRSKHCVGVLVEVEGEKLGWQVGVLVAKAWVQMKVARELVLLGRVLGELVETTLGNWVEESEVKPFQKKKNVVATDSVEAALACSMCSDSSEVVEMAVVDVQFLLVVMIEVVVARYCQVEVQVQKLLL